MKVTISNEIRIQDPSEAVVSWAREALTLPNPEYSKKLRMGLWVGRTESVIRLYYIDGNSLVIPAGAGRDAAPYLEGCEIAEDLTYSFPMEFPGTVPLYDYQKAAVQAMADAGNGILQSPCGSGKTQMGLALAAKVSSRVLWLTHTADLLNQSYDRAKQYFPEGILGKITAGKVQIGSHMTFATVQTLSKLDLQRHKYSWDTVIVDECHRVSGSPSSVKMFYKVMSSLAARHKYGLSATVHRADGLIKSTLAVIGPVVYKVPDEAVAEKTMQVTVRRRDTGVELGRECLDTDGTLEYSKLIPFLTSNQKRNAEILKDLLKNAACWNLILSDRLDHLRRLMAMLPEEYRPYAAMIDGHMTSKRGREQRERAIEDMREGKKHFLFASYSLAKEGLDIPRLDRLYLTTPKKDYAVITQSIGRIARTFPGKSDAVCYDYVDSIGFCENQYKRRKTSYRKAGCVIRENP